MLSGCSTVSKWTNGQKKIQTVQSALDTTTTERLQAVSRFAYGTSVALDLTNTADAVRIAKQTNQRVEALAPAPAVKDLETMQIVVHQLETNDSTALKQQDTVLASLQGRIDTLSSKLDKITQRQLDAGSKNAAELTDYQKWFGLGAILKGSGHLAIWLAVFAVIFFILRLLSSTSPIAASIFGVFEGFGAMAIKAIHGVFGAGAHEVAGLITKAEAEIKAIIPATVPNAPVTQPVTPEAAPKV